MDITQKHLDDLSDIKNMMERSSKFLTLSGLSGVMAGLIALLGAGFAYVYLYDPLKVFQTTFSIKDGFSNSLGISDFAVLVIDAIAVLVLAGISAIIFSYRKAKKLKVKFWDKTAEKLWNSIEKLL